MYVSTSKMIPGTRYLVCIVRTLLLVMNSKTPSLAMTTNRSCFVTFNTSCSGSANTPTVSASESPRLLQNKSPPGTPPRVRFQFRTTLLYSRYCSNPLGRCTTHLEGQRTNPPATSQNAVCFFCWTRYAFRPVDGTF